MSKKKIILSLVCIGGVGLLLYANSLYNQFQFDDYDAIVNNQNIHDITDINALKKAYPSKNRFIDFFTFALNYHFHGENVFGYHLINVLIHILSSLAVM